jgi:D-sedoheptulose 7-phosphate isomerase
MSAAIDRTGPVIRQIREGVAVARWLESEAKNIVVMAEALVAAFRRGNKVLVFGNGGSAADAQHIAAELAGRQYLDRDSLPAIALTTNSSSVTAIANDYGYDTIFAHQLRGLAVKGDVAFGMGAGGNSPNVVAAFEEAKRRGAITIGFTGKKGGKTKDLCDFVLYVPFEDTARIQEAHMMAGHIICGLVEEIMFGDGSGPSAKK